MKERADNIYDKIREFLGTIPGNLAVLEQQIDTDVQLEYHHLAEKEADHVDPARVQQIRKDLFKPELSVTKKKKLLVQLAKVGSIESYRTLEDFFITAGTELKDWVTLALQENKMLLESNLLDENQVLISTGLGGKGLKLRYFTVLLTATGHEFNGYQKKMVESEMQLTLKKCSGEMESIHFDKELCSIISVIPLQIPIQSLFDKFIEECNQYGNFLNTECLITNVKILTGRQIRTMMRKGKIEKKTRI
jgi:hypothetical protein